MANDWNDIIYSYFRGEITLDEFHNQFIEEVEKEIYNQIMNNYLPIEICIGNQYDDSFNHWGYYDNPDEAIEALLWIKEHMAEMMEEKE